MNITRRLREELVSFTTPDGRQAVAILPAIPDTAPFRIREGVARRRISAVTGECPCGARVDYGADDLGDCLVAEVTHERTCPADTARLAKALRRWAA